MSHIPLPALDAFAAVPQPVPDGVPVILGAGRLVPEKGFANLITAFARMPDRQARLVIAGDGPERQNLLALAESLGVASRLSMPGYVRNIRPLLDQARLFVLASDYEGYPAVLIEALEAGRPIVATDCTPATTELVRKDWVGRVVPRGDGIALAEAIASMLQAPVPDPARLSALASPFRIDRIAQQYLDLFDDVYARAAVRHRRPVWPLAWPVRTQVAKAIS